MWVSKNIIEQYKKDLDKAKRETEYWAELAIHYSEVISIKEMKIISLQNLVKEQLKYIKPPLKEFEAKIFYGRNSEDYFTLYIKDVKNVKEAQKKVEEKLASLDVRGHTIELQEIHKEEK